MSCYIRQFQIDETIGVNSVERYEIVLISFHLYTIDEPSHMNTKLLIARFYKECGDFF